MQALSGVTRRADCRFGTGLTDILASFSNTTGPRRQSDGAWSPSPRSRVPRKAAPCRWCRWCCPWPGQSKHWWPKTMRLKAKGGGLEKGS